MARIRSIKPEFWLNEAIAGLSHTERLAFLASRNFADDKGRLKGADLLLHGQFFPFDRNIDIAKIKRKLTDAGLWFSYRKAGVEFIAIPQQHFDQRIDKPTPSTIPAPDMIESLNVDPENSQSAREDSVNAPLLGVGSKAVRQLGTVGGRKARRRDAANSPTTTTWKHTFLLPLWNTAVANTPIPQCHAWSDELDAFAGYRIAEHQILTAADWSRAFAATAASPFLRGEKPGADGTPFTGASLLWLLSGPNRLPRALSGEAPFASVSVRVRPCPSTTATTSPIEEIKSDLLERGIPTSLLAKGYKEPADWWQRAQNHIRSTCGDPEAENYHDRCCAAFSSLLTPQ
jgi:hypothetical protein